MSKKSRDYLSENVPLTCLSYVDVISTFENVVKSCYGWKLSPSYKADIAAFGAAYRKLKVNDTTKIHIVIEHLPEFIEKSADVLGQKTGLALYTGIFSYSNPVSIVASNPRWGAFH